MATSGRGLRFGAFEIDPQSGELRKHGVRIRLQEQPFKILMALLEKPGEVVSREELRERIWGNDTFVDFDHGLNAAVNRLREALSDSAENPRFVETLARRGYRFISAVEGTPKAEPVPAPPASNASAPRRRWQWVALTCAGVSGAIGIGVWLAVRQPLLPPVQVVPLTTLTGLESEPTFSPDGKQVAFTWTGEKQDNTDIYVKLVRSVVPLRLTSDPAPDVSPAWSPDGSQIAFVRMSQTGETDGASVMLISPLGGAERKLTGTRPARERSVAWSPDGKMLALAEEVPRGVNGIFVIPMEGGEKRRLTSNQTGVDGVPAFSADGRFLAYASCSSYFSCDVHVLGLGPNLAPSGQPRRLTRQGASIRGIAWTADGRSLVYAASRDIAAAHYLYLVQVSGAGEAERLELAGADAAFPAIPRVGNVLAFARGGPDPDIWKWEAGAPMAEFIASTRFDDSPQFSPDGGRIAFASSRAGGGNEVWVCDRDGSNPAQLTNGLGRHQGSPRWSPDGHFLVFDSQGEDGHFDIYVMEAVGGMPRRLTSLPSDEAIPSYSRDGQWVYFGSNRSGRFEIWRIPAGGGGWNQMTSEGGHAARESWDGKTLYYDKAGMSIIAATPLFAKPLAGGPERRVIDAVMTREFLPVEDGIYYIGAAVPPSQEYSLMFFDFAAGGHRMLTRLATRKHWGLSVSPDRKTVLYSVRKAPSQDLVLVENFR